MMLTAARPSRLSRFKLPHLQPHRPDSLGIGAAPSLLFTFGRSPGVWSPRVWIRWVSGEHARICERSVGWENSDRFGVFEPSARARHSAVNEVPGRTNEKQEPLIILINICFYQQKLLNFSDWMMFEKWVWSQKNLESRLPAECVKNAFVANDFAMN